MLLSPSRIFHIAQKAGIALLLTVALVGCDSGGGNDTTDPGSGTDDPGPVIPDAPSNLTATSGDAQVTLDWPSVSQAERYTVYRATTSDPSAPGETVETGLTSTEYTDTGVSNGVTYYYQVTAVADEESELSDEAEVTPFSPPPSRP